MKKATAIMLVFLLLLGVFAGCGKTGGDSKEAASGADAAQNEAVSQTVAATTEQNNDEAKAAAAEIDSKISELGTVNVALGNDIKTIRKEYDNASEDVKSFVTKLDVLTAAEAEFNKLVDEHGPAAVNAFYTDEDQVEKITWYMPNAMPEYIDTRSYVMIYVGVQNGSAWPVVRWNYTGDDWVFYKKAVIATDTQKYTKTFKYFDINHDNEGGNVWETYDQTDVTYSDLKMLYDMATSSSTIVRFDGDNYSYDLTLTADDKATIMNGIYAYYYLSK